MMMMIMMTTMIHNYDDYPDQLTSPVWPTVHSFQFYKQQQRRRQHKVPSLDIGLLRCRERIGQKLERFPIWESLK